MMISDSVPCAVLFPFTSLESGNWAWLEKIFESLAVLENAFPEADNLPKEIVRLQMFSPEELTRIRRMVLRMTEMGQNNTSTLRNTWTLNDKPFLAPEIASLTDEIRHREKEPTKEKEPSADGVLLSLFDRWDRDQIELLSRFSSIGQTEKKIFQDVLAVETGQVGGLGKKDFHIDLGDHQPEKRIRAWLACAALLPEKLPRIWVCPSPAIINWLVAHDWLDSPVSVTMPAETTSAEEKSAFWKKVTSVKWNSFDSLNSSGIEVRLWRVKSRDMAVLREDVVFCGIGLDG